MLYGGVDHWNGRWVVSTSGSGDRAAEGGLSQSFPNQRLRMTHVMDLNDCGADGSSVKYY